MTQETNLGTPEPEEATTTDRAPSGVVSHLVIGRIVTTRGVQGELKVEILTDFPQRFAKLKKVYLGDVLAPHAVERSRLYQNVALIKLRDIDTAEAAAALKGKLVYVPLEDAVQLEEGLYYWHEVIGLEVVTTEGERLGRVADIITTGANDVYVIRNAGEVKNKEILIPVIEDVIKQIDPKSGKIVVELIPGLLS